MSKIYLVKLTPVDKFFFGGEITFTRDFNNRDKESRKLSADEKELRKFDEEYSSYVVKSNLFPQQTSLLGMFRFLLLSNSDKSVFSNNKIQSREEAKKIIGPGSFLIDSNNYDRMDFGKIKSLSPCFIRRKASGKDWENIFCAPLDKELNVRFDAGDVILNEEKSFIPYITYKKMKDNKVLMFNQKDGLQSLYIGDKGLILNEEDLFIEDARIGIDRNFDGKTQEGAFYKQISYRLTNKLEISENKYETHELHFALYIEVADDCSLPEKYIVSIGGDNSQFTFESQLIETQEDSKIGYLYPVDSDDFDCYSKVVLMSDAFIDTKKLSSCIFAINETIPFRFLVSDITTQDYYKFSGKSHLKRSEEKYNLYKRGSVFYFESDKQLALFETALNEKYRFCQIGYNHYKSIIKK